MPPAFDPYYKWLGIPADEQPADHYRLLGLRRFESDAEVIQAAADRQMAHVRNYASGPHGELSQRLLNEIAAAKLQLLEGAKKATYDQSLRSAMAVGTPLPAATAITTRPPHVVAPAAQSQAFPADIAEFDAPPSRPKRPGSAGGKKSSSVKALAGMAGSAITLLIVGAFVWMRMGADQQVASSSNPAANQRPTAPQAASSDPTSQPTVGAQPGLPVGQPPAAQPQPTAPKSNLPDKGGSNTNGPNSVPSNSAAPNSTPPKPNPPDSTSPNTAPPGANAAQAKGPIDLLATIDPQADAVNGTWRHEGKALVSSNSVFAVARIPYVPPSDYILECDVERRSGIDSVAIGLVVDKSQTVIVFDGWGGTKTGMCIEGDSWTVSQQQGVLTQPMNHIVCQVGPQYINVFCNHRRVLQWSGDPKNFRGGHQHWRRTDGNGLFIGTFESSFAFHKLELKAQGVQSPTLAEKAPVRPTRVVDLLKMTEAANGKEGTGLRFDGGALVVEPANGRKINFGYKLPLAYTLSLTVERNGNEPLQDIAGTVVVGGRECAWTIDGTRQGDFRSGFRVDNAAYGENESTRNGQFLRPEESNEIIIKVRGDSANISCNNTLVLQWAGDCARLGNPQHDSLALTGWRNNYKVTKLLLSDNTTTDPGGSFNSPIANNTTTSSPKAVNLLNYVDKGSDDFTQHWRMEGNSLVALAGGHRLPVAYSVPEEYDFTIVAQRQGANGWIGGGLWSGNVQFVFFIDTENGDRRGAGLQQVDGKDWRDNETYVNEMLLKDGVPSTVTCSVRQGRVSIVVDGRSIIDWKGDLSRLSNRQEWLMRTAGQIQLHTEGSFKITKLELIPFGARSTRPSGSQPTLPSKPAIVKLPVPNAAAQRESLKLIREEFRSTYEKAKTPEKRFALAKKLYAASQSSTSKPSRCYALLREAADLAADVGQAQDAMVAINELVRRYELDDLALQSEVLLAAAKNVRDPDGQKYLVDQASLGIERALTAERFDIASRLMKLALAAAAKSKDPDLLKQVREGNKRLDDIQASFRKSETALAALKRNPDDPDANLLAGKFYCFTKDDWTRGLPHLAKGSDAALAELATRDLANPASAEEQIKLADDWWSAAEADKTQSANLKSRAKHWYGQALPELKGLEKTRVSKRLEESGADAAETVVYLDDLQEKSFVGYDPHLGKRGKNAFDGATPATVQGVTPAHSLMATPRINSDSRIVYDVPGNYSRFRAMATLTDGDVAAQTPVTFKILGDGKELWRSKPIQRRVNKVAESDACNVKITGVRKLELVIDCPGTNFGSSTIWVDPQVSR